MVGPRPAGRSRGATWAARLEECCHQRRLMRRGRPPHAENRKKSDAAPGCLDEAQRQALAATRHAVLTRTSLCRLRLQPAGGEDSEGPREHWFGSRGVMGGNEPHMDCITAFRNRFHRRLKEIEILCLNARDDHQIVRSSPPGPLSAER